MASLYIHIPFCKKACHYCSFYFVLSTAKKTELVNTLIEEFKARKDELRGQRIDSIYFGGGTPSILTTEEIGTLLQTLKKTYSISNNAEITTESNPENLSFTYLTELKSIGINRLSIGVQSFFDEDLSLMNRNHSSLESKTAICEAVKIFDNVSIDLMFGLPYSGLERWKQNLETALNLGVQHISTYNLTVEEKTALARKVERKEVDIEPDSLLNEMYYHTRDFLTEHGFNHYEISNFGKEGFESKHNLGYWNDVNYLGFGPSAHSYHSNMRRWNIANLNQYIERIKKNEQYWEIENLNSDNQYNEYILTRLRTNIGVDSREISKRFGEKYSSYFLENVASYIQQGFMESIQSSFLLTKEGQVLADYISSELMM